MVRFHTELISDVNNIVPISYMDAKIGSLIYEKDGNEDYSDVLAQNEEWDVFFHLCDLRRGILNWYNFKSGARVLEIEGQFGATTGMLSDMAEQVVVTESNPYRAWCVTQRYKNRSNIDVYAGHIFDIASVCDLGKFDYIILLGTLERVGNGDPNPHVYADYLLKIQNFLKEDGKIILAVSNRFALRNFCGERDSITGRPFDGINHYPFGSNAYTFSKHELENILLLSKLESKKFFYPLPDYKVPQLIYSDEYFSEKEVYERLSTYSQLGDTLVAWERNLYKDIIENKVQDFFANSFLVECSKNQPQSDVAYVVLSTDRGLEGSCTTAIYGMNKVEKRYVFPEGKERLTQAAKALDELKERGLSVVDHSFDGRVLSMPYEKAETLSDYLKKVATSESDEMYRLFEELYRCILQSAEHIEAERNYFWNLNPNLDYGPILKKAYLDMVPANCFYDGKKMIFFDQEFTRENFPAKYVLYRAIKYTYMYLAGIVVSTSIDKLKDAFQLNEIWDIFDKEEAQFIAKNRKTDAFKTYYRGVYLDFSQIYHNAEKLTYKGESVTQFDTSTMLQQVQQIRMGMLEAIHEICRRHGLRYFIAYGTLLGAVRHKNFVPWDDDADVAMPREDYEKFLKICAEELKDGCTIQTMYNDDGCFYGGYAKLRMNQTTAIEYRNWGKKCHQGIWVDIIPIDNAYDDDDENLKIKRKVYYYQCLLYVKTYNRLPEIEKKGIIKEHIYRKRAKKYDRQTLCRKLDEVMQSCNQNTGVKAIFSHITGLIRYKCFDKQDFDDAVMMDFADMRLAAPVNYRHCLEVMEGKDYMRIPPLTERKRKHDVFYDCANSYEYYTNKFMLPESVEGSRLVAIGELNEIQKYINSATKKMKPDLIVCDRYTENKFMGIQVSNLENIINSNAQYKLVICNGVNFREMEEKVKNAGIDDFYIWIEEPAKLFS